MNEKNKNKKNKKKQSKQRHVLTKEARILFSPIFGKNANATFISSQLSSYVTISVALQQNSRDLRSHFLCLTYCKSEVELSGQEKIMKGTLAEETVVEGS